MRKLLDKMFANKKLSLIIPIAIALFMYLLFVFFGTSADKINLMTVTPIVSVIGFFLDMKRDRKAKEAYQKRKRRLRRRKNGRK